MSQIKTKTRLENRVQLVTVPLLQLRAQAAGELFNAFNLGRDEIERAQRGSLDGDLESVEIIHKNKNGRLVGSTSYRMPRIDPAATVSVVDRAGQTAIAALSQKAEAAVALQMKIAERKGWVSEARYIIAEDRDLEAVRAKLGLSPVDDEARDLETYVEVEPGRDPGSAFTLKRRRKRQE